MTMTTGMNKTIEFIAHEVPRLYIQWYIDEYKFLKVKLLQLRA
jgi:hypothetical protein